MGELGLFVLGCHAHYNVLVFSALLLTTYGVAALRTGRRRELARLALVPLACVPWVALNAHTILFTSGGGVRWRDIGVTEALAGAFRRVAELPGTPLLALAGAAVAVLVVRRARGLPAGGAAAWRALAALVVLAAVYVVAVAMVTMRAGMMHPRYYLFLLPALHVGLALLVALALERAAVVALALALFAGASAGRLGAYYAQDREGYREATRWLREHLRGDAPLVYTWGPNLPIYRFYLETSFGPDADDRAIRVSAEQEGGAVCERLGDAPKAGLIAHATHRHLAEAALAACGDRYRLAHELEYPRGPRAGVGRSLTGESALSQARLSESPVHRTLRRVSVVVPTYRESANLPHLIDRLAKVRGDARARPRRPRHGRRQPRRVGGGDRGPPRAVGQALVRTTDRGLSAAVLDGMRRARGEVLVCMDADLSHPPEALPAMLRKLEEGADFVIGSRYVDGGSTSDDWGFLRWLNSRVATLLAAPLTSARDPDGGLLRARALDIRARAPTSARWATRSGSSSWSSAAASAWWRRPSTSRTGSSARAS